MERKDLIYVTSAGTYTDIDTYACATAYGELLRLKGYNAHAVISKNFTESIPKFLHELKVEYLDQTTVNLEKADSLIIVDRSDIDGLKSSIDIAKVKEVYDHHFGYEKYWQNLLGKNSYIEKVGSCATLIWGAISGAIRKDCFEQKISRNSLMLIYSAIISNTLNFKAGVTTQKDINSANEIKSLAQIDDTYVEKYFTTVTANIEKDPYNAMLKDVKAVKVGDQKIAIGQLELWNSANVISSLVDQIPGFLPGFQDLPFFITVASISDGKTTFISNSSAVKKLLGNALNFTWISEDFFVLDKLLLRKEIIKDFQAS